MPTPVLSMYDAVDFDAEIRRVAEMLEAGKVVVLPTETVYGAAGRIDHPQTLARLNGLRAGGESKPMTLHLGDRGQAAAYLGEVGDLGQRLMRKLWPGPVGLTFDVPPDRQAQVAASLKVAGSDLYHDGQITLRCPDHLVTAEILSLAHGPVVLTMAAPGAGGPQFKPASLATVVDGKADLIVDAGPTRYTKPSTLLKVWADKFEIVRVGVYDERIIDRLLKTTVLFVCSGNTCRSPMAEGIARDVLCKKLGISEAELDKKGIAVGSAGTFAMPGGRATPQAVEAVKDLGIDLTRHRSRPISVELIHQADQIYTMGRSHAAAVVSLVPSAADKVQTLDPAGDIEDPIGSDLSVYQNLSRELARLIEQRLGENPVV